MAKPWKPKLRSTQVAERLAWCEHVLAERDAGDLHWRIIDSDALARTCQALVEKEQTLLVRIADLETANEGSAEDRLYLFASHGYVAEAAEYASRFASDNGDAHYGCSERKSAADVAKGVLERLGPLASLRPGDAFKLPSETPRTDATREAKVPE